MTAPEIGPQPQDGAVNKQARGRARLHDRDEVAKGEDPLVKFVRVWSGEYAGNSGVERLTGH